MIFDCIQNRKHAVRLIYRGSFHNIIFVAVYLDRSVFHFVLSLQFTVCHEKYNNAAELSTVETVMHDIVRYCKKIKYFKCRANVLLITAH